MNNQPCTSTLQQCVCVHVNCFLSHYSAEVLATSMELYMYEYCICVNRLRSGMVRLIYEYYQDDVNSLCMYTYMVTIKT